MSKKFSSPISSCSPFLVIFVGDWTMFRSSLKQCVDDFLSYADMNDQNHPVLHLSLLEICEFTKDGKFSQRGSHHIICTEPVSDMTAKAIVRNAQASMENIFAIGVDLTTEQKQSLAVEKDYTIINLPRLKASQPESIFRSVLNELFELPDLSNTIDHSRKENVDLPRSLNTNEAAGG